MSPPVLAEATRRFRLPHTPFPRSQIFSNGSYVSVVTHAGGGASLWKGRCVTRLREDRTRDHGSQLIYLRDVRSGAVWSATYQPVCREPETYSVAFHLEKAVFHRRDDEIDTHLEIAVSPEDDVEVRRLSLANRGDRVREIEVTSYVELVLGGLLETSPIPRSASCSWRPNGCPRARLCSREGGPAARGRLRSTRSMRSLSSGCRRPPSSARPTGPASWAAGAPPRIPARSTGVR